MTQENDAPESQAAESGAAAGGQPALPVYELKSYDPVEIELPRFELTDEQIDQQIMQYAEQYGAEYVPTDRKVVGPKEDIKIDISVSKDGKEVENLNADDRLYSLNQGFMPPDFDAHVMGMNVGETREFDFKAPDFDDSQAQEAVFHASVTVNRIMRKTVPEITDGWVKKFMPMHNSAKEFRAYVADSMRQDVARMMEQEKNQRAAHALAERFEGKIEDRFYEEARASLIAQYEQQAAAQGLSLNDMIAQQGMDQNNFSMMLMMQVREIITQGFSLDSWARHYGLEASEADVKELAQMMAPQGKADEFLSHLEQNPADKREFENAALRYVANKDLAAKAKVTYVEEPAQ